MNYGIIRQAGWENCTGTDKHVFRVIVDYPEGAPDLSFSVIWDSLRVQIVLVQPQIDPYGAIFHQPCQDAAAKAIGMK